MTRPTRFAMSLLAAAGLALAAGPALAQGTTRKPAAEAPRKGHVAPDARHLVAKVQAFYEHTKAFEASFQQTYVYKAFHRQMHSAGTVAFKKPGLMRWDYETPRKKSFIVDGHDLWIWTPEDMEVIRRKGFSTNQLSTSITFLWGRGRLADDFDIVKDGKSGLKLTPLTPQGFQSVRFEVDAKTGQVTASTVVDAQGNENRFVFSDLKLNPRLPDSRFHFTPPKGAEVKELTDRGLN
jgi:outer membrane lipoprotein carrier protein